MHFSAVAPKGWSVLKRKRKLLGVVAAVVPTVWATFRSVNQQHQSTEQRLGNSMLTWLNNELSTCLNIKLKTKTNFILKVPQCFSYFKTKPPWCSRLYLCGIQCTINTLQTLETNKTNFMLTSVSIDNWTAVQNALTLTSPTHVPWLSSAHQEIWSSMSMFVHERYVENPPVHPSNPLNKKHV